jgi:hypothetical protein
MQGYECPQIWVDMIERKGGFVNKQVKGRIK